MSLRKQRGNMDQRKKEPPVCANSADTGGFYTNLQIYLANLLKKQAFFFIPLLLYPLVKDMKNCNFLFYSYWSFQINNI